MLIVNVLAFRRHDTASHKCYSVSCAGWCQSNLLYIQKVREEFISYYSEENMEGLSGIDGPILNHTGEILADFAVSGSTEVINEKKDMIIESIQHTSRSVSIQLGWNSSNINR